MTKSERITKWVNSLSIETLRTTLYSTTEYLIDTANVRFPEDARCPYWDSVGEAVDGSDDPLYED